MTVSEARWTMILLAALAGLTLATALVHVGTPAERAPLRAAPVRPADETPPLIPEAAPARPPSLPADPVPVIRRKARDEGYREAREASGEGALAGQVISSEGPIANIAVRVEWVLALEPGRGEIARLKRAGARRDPDGVWWARALVQTDESGCFLFEGLPAVPLRLHAGSTTQQVQVGGFARIRTERP